MTNSDGTSNATTNQEWEQRFDAIARLYREAHEKLETDPLSAALRARQAIEHIADYLHLRELGPAARNDMLDAKLKRIDAKLVFPRMVATHFGTVQIHTNSVIHPGGMASDPDADLLRPCLGSLVIAVEWFFRDYLKRPAPQLPNRPAGTPVHNTPAAPDATPMNSTVATMTVHGATRFGTGIGEFIPVWRTNATASILRLDAAENDVSAQHVFKFEGARRQYTLGRTENRSDGSPNDFALPKTWNSISRDQAIVTANDGGLQITNTSSNNNFFVRGEAVAKGATRALRHGDVVQLGRCVGTFSDGRYYAAAPAVTIDMRTGLLSRAGLVSEIAGFLAAGKPRVLFVVRCPDAVMSEPSAAGSRDSERLAADVARALHRHDPSVPVARIGMDVAALLPSDALVAAFADVVTSVAGAKCVSGFMTLTGLADQATPRLEACLGALSRIAIAGREPSGPEDLTRYALTHTTLEAFASHTAPLFEVGGGAVLFALGELDQLEQLMPQAIPVLELELVEMLGARMGPRDVVSFVGPGLVLFGTPGDVERFAHETGVAWHARGPVTAGTIEIDRCLSAHLLSHADLGNIAERAVTLAKGGLGALGIGALPAPLALAARAVDESRDGIERARALIAVGELAWKFLTFVLLANARAAHAIPPDDAQSGHGAWPTPWRSLARDAARSLKGQHARMKELADVALSAEGDGPLRAAMETVATASAQVSAANVDAVAIERTMPRLEKAVREIFTALSPLRGWTLVNIESSEVVDVDGTTQRVEYTDYTGPSARGSNQRVAVTGFKGLGRFVYLVRWNEGLAIALEPFARRARNQSSGDNELFLAAAPIVEPGQHRYLSVASTHELELPVTAKQLGVVRRSGDGVREG